MVLLEKGCFITILEKYAEPLIKGLAQVSRDEWEKFKIDFDLVFHTYIKNSYDKYSKIKTILYRIEPKYIYDFFVAPTLEKENGKYVQTDDVDNILNISHFVIIQGTGGIGKSTLLKHLFINELEKKGLIPIFIELKDFNDIKTDDYEISDIVFEKLNILGSKLKKEYLEYALKSGCFLFLLDGYDEILTNKRNMFYKKLDAFCDRYVLNYFVISSRPYSEFIEFQRYTVLSTCLLEKTQAKLLVDKIEFDKEIKQRFIKALDEKLFDKHQSFASNPLLLNIMLLTFDNYAEIPEKMHLFYANAFETLYSKHDATKAGYKRELRSNLSYDSFKKVFSYVCFITYNQGRIEFLCEELKHVLKRSSISSRIDFDIEAYILDLTNSLCVVYKDGLNYKFAHRSFQEYFTAVFLKELSDESMKRMATQMIERDAQRVTQDEVFPMLYDMAEDRFEQNILLPVLKVYEKDCRETDKYDFYFKQMINSIEFDIEPRTNTANLYVCRNTMDGLSQFIYQISYYYVERKEELKKHEGENDNKIFQYLVENRRYVAGTELYAEQLIGDKEVYELIGDTWIGNRIKIMSEFINIIEEKQKSVDVDLTDLVDF